MLEQQQWTPSRNTQPSPTDAYGTIEFQGGPHPSKAQVRMTDIRDQGKGFVGFPEAFEVLTIANSLHMISTSLFINNQ